MQGNYSVKIEDFAKRHFIKSFQKKYNKHWDLTLVAITAEFERIDALLQTERAETIIDAETIKIIKTQFRVSGTKESAKTSGNRCIVAWNIDTKQVSILLVYAKTDLKGHNETAYWQKVIKENYPIYKDLF